MLSCHKELAMIYVATNKLVENNEGIKILFKLSKESHNKFRVRCDGNISEKCRFEYNIEYRNFIKYINRNDDQKLFCLFCSRTIKFTGRNNPNTKYKTLDDFFFHTIDSYEKAYLLGWIASDGHCGNNIISLEINLKDNYKLIELKNLICREIPIVYRERENDSGVSSKTIGFTISSKTIMNQICLLLGVKPGKKSNILKMPILEQQFYPHFLRGYLEGDGTIRYNKRKYPRCSITSNSPSMLESIKNIAISFNINCCIYKNNIHFDYNHCIKFLDYIYEINDGFVLKRKFDRYMFWKNTYVPGPKPLKGENSLLSKLTWNEVREIRDIYRTASCTMASIASRFNVSYPTIGCILRNESWHDDLYMSQKTTHLKLNKENILDIRQMIENKISDVKIAKIYQVHPTTIFGIRIGKIWKEI